MGRRSKQRIFPQGTAFVAHSIEMRRSPAWSSLPDNARRVLDRLEVEHMAHGGAENGSLIVTLDQFAEAGIRRASAALAIRQCCHLGFLSVKKSGYAHSNSPRRLPNAYTLTYVSGCKASPNPTDAWRTIDTPAAAEAALAAALVDKVTPRAGAKRKAKAKKVAAPPAAARPAVPAAKPGFDRRTYQRELMRRRRAAAKAAKLAAAA